MDVPEEGVLDVDLLGDDGSEDEGEAPPSSGWVPFTLLFDLTIGKLFFLNVNYKCNVYRSIEVFVVVDFYAGPASTPTSCASSPRGEEPASPHGGSQPSFFHHQPYHRPFFTAGRRGPGRPRKDGPKLTREGKIVRRWVIMMSFLKPMAKL